MSNKRYRQKPTDDRPSKADIHAAFRRGMDDADDILDAQKVTTDWLRHLHAREAAEKREAKADNHGVGDATRQAHAKFAEAMAGKEMPKEPDPMLTDEEYRTILDNLFLKLNHVSNCAMYAFEAVNKRDADRIHARDIAERAAKPERPARAHPLLGLSNFVMRCARVMIQIASITRPQLFEHLKAKTAGIAKAAAKTIKSAEEMAQGTAPGAAPAAS